VFEGADEIILMLLLTPSLHGRTPPKATRVVAHFVPQDFLRVIRSESLCPRHRCSELSGVSIPVVAFDCPMQQQVQSGH
jgi:hypothetical protein